jgi:uncharacterized protein (UPF0332 family)
MRTQKIERNARNFIKVAEFLSKKCKELPKEACRRSIVNRLYYGTIYLVAVELAKTEKFKIPKETPKIHSIVIGRLKTLCPHIGELLNDLHKLRKKADYELYTPFTEDELKLAQSLAKFILREVPKCLSNHRWKNPPSNKSKSS